MLIFNISARPENEISPVSCQAHNMSMDRCAELVVAQKPENHADYCMRNRKSTRYYLPQQTMNEMLLENRTRGGMGGEPPCERHALSQMTAATIGGHVCNVCARVWT